MTISRSLRQKPYDIPASSLATEHSTDLSKQGDESLTLAQSVRSNEQQVVLMERNKIQSVPVEIEKDNSRSNEQGVWNDPTQRIEEDISTTNVLLDLQKQQCDPNDERSVSNVHLSPVKMRDHHHDDISVPNVHLDLQKQQDHPLDQKTVLNVPLDLDKTGCDSKNERIVSYFPCDLHKQQGDQKMSVKNVPLVSMKQPYYPQDKTSGPKVLLEIDKQQVHPLDERPIQHDQIDSDTPSRKFQNEPFFLQEQNRAMPIIDFPKNNQNQVLPDDVSQPRDPYQTRAMANIPVLSSDQPYYSHEDTQDAQCKRFEDAINDRPKHVHPIDVNAATEHESQEHRSNQGSPLVLSGTTHTRFQEDVSMHASKEQIKILTELSEVEQAASGLTHSVETISNPGLITTIKRFFGVSKEVKEIKVSITEEHILKQSLRVGKKKLNQRHIAPVIIWDFGGQDIFYSTHQSFLSYRAIYLIVLDGSRTLDDPCQFDQYLPGKSGQKTARGKTVYINEHNCILLYFVS